MISYVASIFLKSYYFFASGGYSIKETLRYCHLPLFPSLSPIIGNQLVDLTDWPGLAWLLAFLGDLPSAERLHSDWYDCGCVRRPVYL